MFRLSREVRFAADPSFSVEGNPTNSYAGFPTLGALVPWYALRVTLAGEIDRRTSYLRNIQDIDAVVRELAIPIVSRAVSKKCSALLMMELFDELSTAWPGSAVDRLELVLSPLTAVGMVSEEYPMIRLSQKFEFSASHRLHDDAMSEAENRAAFGKCNNPSGHGHNYEVQVTVRRQHGDLAQVLDIERVVKPVIDRFDHRHLNVELAEFRTLNPTVENIARIIFGLLKESVDGLAGVTVWETPKTWCEYSE